MTLPQNTSTNQPKPVKKYVRQTNEELKRGLNILSTLNKTRTSALNEYLRNNSLPNTIKEQIRNHKEDRTKYQNSLAGLSYNDLTKKLKINTLPYQKSRIKDAMNELEKTPGFVPPKVRPPVPPRPIYITKKEIDDLVSKGNIIGLYLIGGIGINYELKKAKTDGIEKLLKTLRSVNLKETIRTIDDVLASKPPININIDKTKEIVKLLEKLKIRIEEELERRAGIKNELEYLPTKKLVKQQNQSSNNKPMISYISKELNKRRQINNNISKHKPNIFKALTKRLKTRFAKNNTLNKNASNNLYLKALRSKEKIRRRIKEKNPSWISRKFSNLKQKLSRRKRS
jgi:hypothetical protein